MNTGTMNIMKFEVAESRQDAVPGDVFTGEFYLNYGGPSEAPRLTFLNRKAKDTVMEDDRIQGLERKMEEALKQRDEEWKKKEEEYKNRIILQEFQIEEMANRQKQLIERMEKLEEHMINVNFPPVAEVTGSGASCVFRPQNIKTN